MESETPTTEREKWTAYKLVIDPALTKGLYKVYRYDGERFSVPVSGSRSFSFHRDERSG